MNIKCKGSATDYAVIPVILVSGYFFRIHSFCWLLFLFRRIKEGESLSSSPLGSFAKLHYVLFPEKAWYSRYEATLSYGTVYHLVKNGLNFRSMKGTDWPWRSTFLWCRQPCSQSFSEENGRVESPGDTWFAIGLDNAFSPFYFFLRKGALIHAQSFSSTHRFFLSLLETTLETRFECSYLVTNS